MVSGTPGARRFCHISPPAAIWSRLPGFLARLSGSRRPSCTNLSEGRPHNLDCAPDRPLRGWWRYLSRAHSGASRPAPARTDQASSRSTSTRRAGSRTDGITSVTFGTNEAARAVAIAWRNDARTLRALMPALRLLSNAREVHLLAGARAGTPTPAIPAVLVEHGIRAALHVLAITSGRFGNSCLAARENSARTC